MSTEPAPDIETFTVAEVALNYPHAIRVLNRWRLDFCCNGKVPFVKACEDLNLNAYTVWQNIIAETGMTKVDHSKAYINWETSPLIDFILQHHHQYLRLTIPTIKSLLETACDVHREAPELQDVKLHFEALSDDLTNHLPREENVLFPALRRLSRPPVAPLPILDNVQKTIAIMEHEHSRTGEGIRAIRRLTNDYTTPSRACTSLHSLFVLLREFEWNLTQHIHLKNNILFPKLKYACKN